MIPIYQEINDPILRDLLKKFAVKCDILQEELEYLKDHFKSLDQRIENLEKVVIRFDRASTL